MKFWNNNKYFRADWRNHDICECFPALTVNFYLFALSSYHKLAKRNWVFRMKGAEVMNAVEEVIALQRAKYLDLERRLVNAMEQLSDDDLNWRPNEESNSIANIVLHITGSLRQRFVAGIGGNTITRDRDDEFNSRTTFTKAQLIEMVKDIFQMVHRVLQGITPEKLTETYSIRGKEVSTLAITFDSIHIAEHVGQVVYIAKMRLGSEYQIQWMPHQRK